MARILSQDPDLDSADAIAYLYGDHPDAYPDMETFGKAMQVMAGTIRTSKGKEYEVETLGKYCQQLHAYKSLDLYAKAHPDSDCTHLTCSDLPNSDYTPFDKAHTDLHIQLQGQQARRIADGLRL